MSESFLSQEEIDSILTKKTNKTVDQIDDLTKDLIGEVANISMSTAATTLSSILNHQVLITTPRVSIVPFQQIVEECQVPKVVANVEFKSGLTGTNFLMVDINDSAVIADLMMGGDGTSPNLELTELEFSALAEAMNQMIGSASTSMATMIGQPVDIQPPTISLWDTENNLDTSTMDVNEQICKIAFDLTVEGLIQSEIMQIYTLDTVNNISEIMMGPSTDAMVHTEQTPVEEYYEEPIPEENYYEEPESPEEASPSPIVNKPQEKVEVQKPGFQALDPSASKKAPPRNLDLIMDVPLEFSVVLGKSRKTIKEVLSFGTGSIVELNKLADEPLEIFVNGKLIAEGEVVVINENFGIRITNILSKEQRLRNL